MVAVAPTPDAPRVYLDHAATSTLRAEAREAMLAHLDLGNASSLHAEGRRARRVVEEAREQIAECLGARPNEVVFTSGGTESDNLAVKGAYWAARGEHGVADAPAHSLLISAVEHHAVLDSAAWLARTQHADVRPVGVDGAGRVRPEQLAELLAGAPRTALVSVMWANNETGVLQPLDEVVAVCRRAGVPVHTDAVQAVGAVPLDFAESGVDLLTATGHKLGGPHGAGLLVARQGVLPAPLLHGGGQERDLRSGTVAAPVVAGLAAAIEAAVKEQAAHAVRVAHLRDELERGLRALVPGVEVNGAEAARLPGVSNVRFPGCEGDSLLMLLDSRGVAVSSGAACSAGVPQPSHVLLAMGRSETEAREAVRFSFGHDSRESDVTAVLEAIGPVVERAGAAGRAGRRGAR